MTDLSLCVGITGNVTWMLLFFSSVHEFYQIVKNRPAGYFENGPYTCALRIAAIWIYYGIIKPNSILIATGNGIGIVIETISLILFLIYASPNIKVRTIRFVVLNVVFLGALVSFAEILLDGETRIYFIGFLGAALDISMYTLSLAAVITVVRTQSVEYISLLFSLLSFFHGGIWTFYAILVKDYFIGVPNVLGFLFATGHLLLYYIYSNRRNSNEEVISLEDGSQNETLIS